MTDQNSAENVIKKSTNALTSGTASPLKYPLNGTPKYGLILRPVKYENIITLKVSNPSTILEKLNSKGQPQSAKAILRQGGPSISLPLPENIADSIGIAYNEADLGIAAVAFAAGQSIGNAIQGKGGATAYGAALAAVNTGGYALRSVADKIGDIGSLIDASTGATPNPYSAAIFKNVTARQWAMQFTFMPTSSEESDELREIINTIRYLSLPEKSGNFLKFPSEWEMGFFGSEYLFEISRGVITDINVQYGASGGLAFFADNSAPQTVKMSFSFREILPLDRTLLDGTGMAPKKIDTTSLSTNYDPNESDELNKIADQLQPEP